MKKIVALVLCLVMVVGLMVGCEKRMDVETLVQKMDEAMKDLSAFGGNMEMDLEMTMGMSGITLNMNMGMDVDMQVDIENRAGYIGMDATVEVLGQSEKVGMEMYMNAEDGKMVTYTHDTSADIWTKSEEEADFSEAMDKFQTSEGTFSEMPKDKMSLAKEKETVDGHECYVLTVDMDGEYFKDTMEKSMEESMEESTEELDEESKELMENLMKSVDWSALSCKMVYYVDAETFLPVKMTGELDGMSELMNSLFTGVMGEMMMIGVDSEEAEFSLEIPTVEFGITDLVFSDVEVPAVPQEGIDNAIDENTIIEDDIIDDEIIGDDIVDDEESLLSNPPQEDGSYILTLGEDSVRVVLPEGYTPVITEAEWMNVCAADGMNEVYYELLQGMTDADMRAYVEGDVAWAKEEGAYQSHGDGEEFAGFTTMSLVLNDGTVFYYAWKDLDSCLLTVEAWAYTAPVDMDALLTDVEILSK